MGRSNKIFDFYQQQLKNRGLDLERVKAGAYLIKRGEKTIFVAKSYGEVRAFILGFDTGVNFQN